MAALRAAVFPLSAKTGGVGIFCPPPPPVRVLNMMSRSDVRLTCVLTVLTVTGVLAKFVISNSSILIQYKAAYVHV